MPPKARLTAGSWISYQASSLLKNLKKVLLKRIKRDMTPSEKNKTWDLVDIIGSTHTHVAHLCVCVCIFAINAHFKQSVHLEIKNNSSFYHLRANILCWFNFKPLLSQFESSNILKSATFLQSTFLSAIFSSVRESFFLCFKYDFSVYFVWSKTFLSLTSHLIPSITLLWATAHEHANSFPVFPKHTAEASPCVCWCLLSGSQRCVALTGEPFLVFFTAAPTPWWFCRSPPAGTIIFLQQHGPSSRATLRSAAERVCLLATLLCRLCALWIYRVGERLLASADNCYHLRVWNRLHFEFKRHSGRTNLRVVAKTYIVNYATE